MVNWVGWWLIWLGWWLIGWVSVGLLVAGKNAIFLHAISPDLQKT